MTVKASIVVMSHLSDAQIEVSFDKNQARQRMNFVKYIILQTGGNLTQEINPDELWERFNLKDEVNLSKLKTS